MTASTYPPGLAQLKGSVPLDLEPPGQRNAWKKGDPRLCTLRPLPFLAISVHSSLRCTWPWLALTSLTCKIQMAVCSYFRDKAQRREVTCPRPHNWQAVESGFKPGCLIPEPTSAPTTVPGTAGCDIGHPSLPLSVYNRVVRTCPVWGGFWVGA